MSVSMGGGRQGGGATVVTVLLLLACALVAPATAGAETFTVNSTGDQADSALGVGCLTEQEKGEEKEEEECTLRAAIEKANSAEESGTIQFEEEVFEGEIADTIALGSSLPTATVPLFINGRICGSAAEVSRPCVGIDGPIGESALVFSAVEGGEIEGVEILGLAMTGAQTAITLEGSPEARIRSSWFGIALDGAPGGNAIGVLVGAGSNRSFIGGEGAEDRNVFAGNSADGLDIHGAGNARVFGNYFGVAPDGVTPRANGGDDIAVASVSEGPEAIGTAIGTRVSAVAAASPQCDGGCNVISSAASNGIDLAGEGGLETPAPSASVVGNYIGLNADGTAAIPNAGAGVRVGEAAHTLIGGSSAGETNRINGGSVGVLAGPAAGDLSVRGNLIGTDATGGHTFAPPDRGIVVNSAELPGPAVEAEIGGNLIGMEGGVAISQQGPGAWVFDNRIFGAQIGIKTFESGTYGNVIEGNLIEGPAANGVLVENEFNEIVGNSIFGAGGAGIWVQGALFKFGVNGNLIGGDTAEDENFIAGSGGAAIEISNPEKTGNEVGRNSGIANGGLFIDLVAASPATEKGGPNRGIKPPTFSTSTTTEVSGGAIKGATVRVFRKQFAATGELESFLGDAVASSSGGWKVTYGSAIPAGTIIAATQTKEGATSELAIATTPGSSEGTAGAAGIFGSGAPGALEGEGARIRPQTKILEGRSRNRTARFVFNSDQVGSTFLCKLDGKPFDLCGSPKRYAGLGSGKHVFWVRAIDPGGRVDLSPAKKKFVVPG